MQSRIWQQNKVCVDRLQKKKKINQNNSQSRLISKDQLIATSQPWPFLSQVSQTPGSVNRLTFNIIHLPFQREALSTIRNSKKLQLWLYELQLVTAVKSHYTKNSKAAQQNKDCWSVVQDRGVEVQPQHTRHTVETKVKLESKSTKKKRLQICHVHLEFLAL